MIPERHEYAAPTSSAPLGCIQCGQSRFAPIHDTDRAPDMETFFRENVVGVSVTDPQAATRLTHSGSLPALLTAEINAHDTELRGESGRSTSYEDGFVKGLEHVRDNL